MAGAIGVLGLGLMSTLWLRTPTYEGRSVGSWLGDLNGKSSEKEEKAEEAIKALGEDALPAMIDYIGSKDSKAKEKFNEWASELSLDSIQLATADDRRSQARHAFEVLGESAGPAIPKLIPLLADEETYAEAESALESIGPAVVPALIDALRQQNPALREHVASALSNFKTNAVEITEALKPFLNDRDSKVRSKVMSALYQLNEETEYGFAIFNKALSDPDPVVRCDALDMLSTSEGRSVDAYLGALRDPAVSVRSKAVGEFRFLPVERIVPLEKLMPALIEALNDHPDVQRQTIKVLWKFRDKAVPAVGMLTKFVSNQVPFTDERGAPIIDDHTRDMELFSFLEPYQDHFGCFGTSSGVGGTAKRRSQLVLNTFNLPTNALPLTIGDVAAIALRDIDATAAYPIFLNQMKAGSVGVRIKAIYNLGLLAERSEFSNTTIPRLIESLDDPVPDVRFSAISALAQFHTNAHAAVPILVRLSRDKSPTPYFTRYPDLRATVKGQFPLTIAETANIALSEIAPGR